MIKKDFSPNSTKPPAGPAWDAEAPVLIKPPPGLHVRGVVRWLTETVGKWLGEDSSAKPPSLQSLRELCREALEKRGEISGVVAVFRVADGYQRMSAEEKGEFFRMLAENFPVDAVGVDSAISAYQQAVGGRVGEIQALKKALESPRLSLLRLFNTIPSGMKFLVDMRADLLPHHRRDPELAGVAYDLRYLLKSWFNLGFLRLERITWETSATILEKLIQYEAVHQIADWADLKHRLTSDRGCFAFFHSSMPEEPIIMLEVALVKGLADNVQRLLDSSAPPLPPHQADTAIFYSISSTQKGLAGVHLGNFLIKRVVAELQAEHPQLATFATLSPIPRFRRDFLEPELERGGLARFFEKEEREHLCDLIGRENADDAARETLGRPDWTKDPILAEALRPGLLRAARGFLTEHPKAETRSCPVAHFHASNGALLARINWMANPSPEGLRRSWGIMVNYLYDLKKLETVQTAYVKSKTVTMAPAVRNL